MKIYLNAKDHNNGYLSLNNMFLQKQTITLKQYQVVYDTAAHSLAAGTLILNIDSCITGMNFVSGYSWLTNKTTDKYTAEDQTSIFLPLDNSEITNKVCDIPIDLASDLREDSKWSITSIGTITGIQYVVLIFSFDSEAV